MLLQAILTVYVGAMIDNNNSKSISTYSILTHTKNYPILLMPHLQVPDLF